MRAEWKRVKYPPIWAIPYTILILPIRLWVLLLTILLEVWAIMALADIQLFRSNLGQIFITVGLAGAIYQTVKAYKRLNNRNRKPIKRHLLYLIDSLGLYDEESYERDMGDGRKVTEKRVVRSIDIRYLEDEELVKVRIFKYGDRFQKMASELGPNLESALSLELEKTYSTVDYFEYVLRKNPDKRISLTSGFASRGSDYIKITENIGYHLSATPHALIVGGTGSGKSYFIFSRIIQYLQLEPRADLRIIDPKKADLSLFRFVEGFENKVATEPNHICKMLREAVAVMEDRYSKHFNDLTAFGKTYRDFGLPPLIIVFDELAAFNHSIDKKLSKEVMEYIFVIIMKGRQAGVTIDIILQRPSADDLPTNIRAQMGFKAGLGNMDSIGYNMIFDTNDVEFKSISEKGGGYIQIDGLHSNPVYFETPHIPKDFNFIAEIEKLMAN